MKMFLKLIIVVAIAVIIGLAISHDPGYVLFSAGNWVIEMPLWLFVFAVVVLWTVLRFVVHIFSTVASIPGGVRSWRVLKAQAKHEKILSEGLEALCNKRWADMQSSFKVLTESKFLPQVTKKVQIFAQEQGAKAGSINAYHQQLSEAYKSLNELNHVWDRVPKALKSEPLLLADYALNLDKLGESEAEKLLRKSLNQKMNDGLFSAFSQIKHANDTKALQFAEGVYKKATPTALNSLSMARLYFRNQLWGRAQPMLDASIKQSPSQEAYHLCAEIALKEGGREAALKYFQLAASQGS